MIPDPGVVVVVGGLHGIGRNIARRFHDDGRQVVILDAAAPAADAPAPFGEARRVDLTRASERDEVLRGLLAEHPRVSALVWSARYRGSGDAWAGEVELGLVAAQAVAEALAPAMAHEAIDGGAMVFLSSTASQSVAANCSPAYHAAKAGLEALVRCLAVSLGPRGIRVNAVAPAYIVKDESWAHFQSQPELVAAAARLHPLGRVGRAADVAGAVRFLCGPDAAFITGQVLIVDGGLGLHNPVNYVAGDGT